MVIVGGTRLFAFRVSQVRVPVFGKCPPIGDWPLPILAPPIKTSKLHDVDPQAHGARIVAGHPKIQIDQLMPWNHGPRFGTLAP